MVTSIFLALSAAMDELITEKPKVEMSVEPEESQEPEASASESQDPPGMEEKPTGDEGIEASPQEEVPEQPNGDGEVEKVDERASAAAEKPAASPPESPKKKGSSKDSVELKVVLLEGKNLDLKEKVCFLAKTELS